MMVFLSLYVIVDGIIVSRSVGTDALGALNIIWPYLSLELAISIMLSAGGSAIISKKLGEGNYEDARKNFSLIILVEMIIGSIFMICGLCFTKQVVLVLGSPESQMQYAMNYLKIISIFSIAHFLQGAFQFFFVTNNKAKIGLLLTIIAGLLNVVLDIIFVVYLKMGIQGAALATGIGYCSCGVVGLLYHIVKRENMLYIVKPSFDNKMLVKSCTNGSSEMIANIAVSVTTFLYNIEFIKYYGDDGVPAITIIMYFNFVISAVFIGYSNGIAPIISYKFGKKDHEQIKFILTKSVKLISIFSVLSLILSFVLVNPVVYMFAHDNQTVIDIALEGFIYYAPSFIFVGISIFASAYFTALSNGLLSAIISINRTFVFLSLSIILLPMIAGKIGLWSSISIAECLGFIIALICLSKFKNFFLKTNTK